jgi:hypothetical protein
MALAVPQEADAPRRQLTMEIEGHGVGALEVYREQRHDGRAHCRCRQSTSAGSHAIGASGRSLPAPPALGRDPGHALSRVPAKRTRDTRRYAAPR